MEVKEKTRRTKKAFWIVGIVVILAITVPIGIWAIVTFTQGGALKIVESSMTTDELGYAQVNGTVQNTSNSYISDWFMITAKFYNSQGELIAAGQTAVGHIAAGETAQFSITCDKQGAVRYKVYFE